MQAGQGLLCCCKEGVECSMRMGGPRRMTTHDYAVYLPSFGGQHTTGILSRIAPLYSGLSSSSLGRSGVQVCDACGETGAGTAKLVESTIEEKEREFPSMHKVGIACSLGWSFCQFLENQDLRLTFLPTKTNTFNS